MKTFVSRACGSLLVGTLLVAWPAFATEQLSESEPEGLPEVSEALEELSETAPAEVSEALEELSETAPAEVSEALEELSETAPAEVSEALAEEATATVGPIARAVFTSGVQDREPIDRLDTVAADAGVLVFFTELSGLAGSRVEHRWVSEDRVPLELTFDVGADHWRVWTQRGLSAGESGPWTVEVLVDGEVLDRFTVGR